MKIRHLIKEDVDSAKKKASDAKKDYLDARRDVIDAEENELELKEGAEEFVDEEGRVAKTQLYTIIHNSHEIYKQLKDEQQLPAWWQSHLAKAEDLILQMHSYFRHEQRKGKKSK